MKKTDDLLIKEDKKEVIGGMKDKGSEEPEEAEEVDSE